MSDFLAMGGYAAYVWPSWGVTVLVLGGLSLAYALKARSVAAALEREEARRGPRRRAAMETAAAGAEEAS
ncbi:heme exporter protein CcmD [Futiania mangrovi]|uniref:Heme exporter protein D n=1 Tax=Futiania mangrovi TaxID=2959716 RepID=A0A9J6PDD7_9PROT|nr:heme exporter protein CcmD [Futiania mangrovii]MCP1336633.1 heme exporter protein CcmD [Futiania mangrovii]